MMMMISKNWEVSFTLVIGLVTCLAVRSLMMPLSHRRLMISLADLQAILNLYNLCLLCWALCQSISMFQITKSIRFCALKTKKSPGPDGIPNVVWKKIRLWAFPSSGGYIQLITRTRLLSKATEASHCGPSSKVPTSKVRWKWLETQLTDLSDSQSTWKIFCRIPDYQCV